MRRKTPAGFLVGCRLYQARSDKGYSLTDCISMVVMRREGLSEVLSNDKHLTQEGVIYLLGELTPPAPFALVGHRPGSARVAERGPLWLFVLGLAVYPFSLTALGIVLATLARTMARLGERPTAAGRRRRAARHGVPRFDHGCSSISPGRQVLSNQASSGP